MENILLLTNFTYIVTITSSKRLLRSQFDSLKGNCCLYWNVSNITDFQWHLSDKSIPFSSRVCSRTCITISDFGDVTCANDK